jgi:predicted methyltransferase
MSGLVTSTIGFAGRVLKSVVRAGDIAVDATAGNGNDTALLARLVGESGRVHAFDVQAEAIANTRERLLREGLADRVVLHETGHEGLLDVLPAESRDRVSAVTFNLGFLPYGEQGIVTNPETTILALDASLSILAPGGVITVVCYTGHPGGALEAGAVHAWCEGLDIDAYRALRYEIVNKKGAAIRLYVIESFAK